MLPSLTEIVVAASSKREKNKRIYFLATSGALRPSWLACFAMTTGSTHTHEVEFEDLPQRREVTWQTAQGDTFLEKASDWVLGNRLRAAVSVWGISMAALIAWQARRPTAWQLKLIESRVYAQGITVASVVGLVGLEAATSSKRSQAKQEAQAK